MVAINPLPYFDPRSWAEPDADRYRRYVAVLASFASWLLSQGYRVCLVPTQLRADPPVIQDVLAELGRLGRIAGTAERLDPPVGGFKDLVRLLTDADVVVATRFHGVVLAQMLGRPTLGIAYRRSTRDLLEDMGQGAYGIDIGELTLEALIDRFTALEADRGASARLQARLLDYGRFLADQYDRVLAID